MSALTLLTRQKTHAPNPERRQCQIIDFPEYSTALDTVFDAEPLRLLREHVQISNHHLSRLPVLGPEVMDDYEARLRVFFGVGLPLEEAASQVIMVQVVILFQKLLLVDFGHLCAKHVGGLMPHEESDGMAVPFQTPEGVGASIAILAPVIRTAMQFRGRYCT